VLEIRQEIAKSSTKKLDAMMKSKCRDNRVRGLVQFYGASRTGRMSGRLVQIQNFPRPTIKDVKGAVADVLR
jgi:DNA polymerase